jgi:hypothetical protein
VKCGLEAWWGDLGTNVLSLVLKSKKVVADAMVRYVCAVLLFWGSGSIYSRVYVGTSGSLAVEKFLSSLCDIVEGLSICVGLATTRAVQNATRIISRMSCESKAKHPDTRR